jgi:hypothetical protein
MRGIRSSHIEPHERFPGIFALQMNRLGEMSFAHANLTHNDEILPRPRELFHFFAIAFRLLACADYLHVLPFFLSSFLTMIRWSTLSLLSSPLGQESPIQFARVHELLQHPIIECVAPPGDAGRIT